MNRKTTNIILAAVSGGLIVLGALGALAGIRLALRNTIERSRFFFQVGFGLGLAGLSGALFYFLLIEEVLRKRMLSGSMARYTNALWRRGDRSKYG